MKLDDVITRAASLRDVDLPARLQWLEDAAAAIEEADLDDEGKAASQQLRAALGAIVVWSQGPKDAQSIVELEALVATLTTRGLLALVQSMSRLYAQLAKERAPRRAECQTIAETYEEIARAIVKGESFPETALEKLREVGRQLS